MKKYLIIFCSIISLVLFADEGNPTHAGEDHDGGPLGPQTNISELNYTWDWFETYAIDGEGTVEIDGSNPEINDNKYPNILDFQLPSNYTKYRKPRIKVDNSTVGYGPYPGNPPDPNDPSDVPRALKGRYIGKGVINVSGNVISIDSYSMEDVDSMKTRIEEAISKLNKDIDDLIEFLKNKKICKCWPPPPCPQIEEARKQNDPNSCCYRH